MPLSQKVVPRISVASKYGGNTKKKNTSFTSKAHIVAAKLKITRNKPPERRALRLAMLAKCAASQAAMCCGRDRRCALKMM